MFIQTHNMMDDLPPHLILDILRRLGDSADVARCRVASSTINSLYQDLRSIHLYCSSDRYAKSRSPLNRPSITPFKAIFRRLITELRIVESLSIGVAKPLREMRYIDVEDDQNDLHLTNEAFVAEWLPQVCDSLKSLKIADFWVQSSWRRSEVLAIISCQCYNLLELEIKNAWLSVDSLNVMPTLLSLTLEYIRLDDEDLDKLNSCFPSLKDLNLVGVGGLQNPKLILLHLQTCQWTVSNAVSSIGIYAPNLLKLKLNCMRPRMLVLDTPSLSDLHLSLGEVGNFIGEEFSNLTSLHLESSSLDKLVRKIPFGVAVRKLSLTSYAEQGSVMLCFNSLFRVFPNVTSIKLTSKVWSSLEMQSRFPDSEITTWIRGFKDITAYLEIHDFNTTLCSIFTILDNCSSLLEMKVFIHRNVVFHVANTLVSKCTTHSSRVKWNWGAWKEGTKDVWIPGGMYYASNE